MHGKCRVWSCLTHASKFGGFGISVVNFIILGGRPLINDATNFSRAHAEGEKPT